MKNWGISVGEVSGDWLGAQIFSELKGEKISWCGTGGQAMEKFDFCSQYSLEKMAVSGFMGVLPSLIFLMKVLKWWKNELKSGRIDMLILVDYADFNMRLLKIAKSLNIPTKVIAPPQMWAWRKSRKHIYMQTPLGCLFEFESELYKKWGLNSTHLGYPNTIPKIKVGKNVGLFPGSRKQYWKRQLGVQLKIADSLLVENRFEDWIWVAPNERVKTKAKSLYPEFSEKIKLIEEASIGYVLTLPGSSTLHLAWNEIPFTVVMKLGFLKKMFIQNWVSLNSYVLPNLILDKNKYNEHYFTNFSQNVSFDVLNSIQNDLVDETEHENWEAKLGTKEFSSRLKAWLLEEYNG